MQQEPKTVLIVEDQIEFRAIHSTFLERHGYRVVLAGDGESALRQAREQNPDVILMDVSLPVLNGIDATRQLKQDPSTRRIPVLMLTAHTYGAMGRRAREAGCDAFLSKPCEPRRVLQEVERCVG
jgi:two-component system, cell cycle response regulator DivK